MEKQRNMVKKTIRALTEAQIIEAYRRAKGEVPEYFIQALKEAPDGELMQAARFIGPLMTAAVSNQAWDDYEEQRKAEKEKSKQSGLIQKLTN
jgi:hypothetical protein